MPAPQILGMGGYPEEALLEHALGLARGARVLYVPTAGAENADMTCLLYTSPSPRD